MVISQKGAAREIRFTMPTAYSRQVPSIELVKFGPLKHNDLSLCAQLMSHANDISPRAALQRAPRGLFGHAGGPLEGSIFGGLAELGRQMEELEAFQEQAMAMADWVESQIGRQPQGGEAAGWGLGQPEADSCPLPGRLTLPGRDTGERQAGGGQAGPASPLQLQARELEQLGARVYLPEANESVDWGMLAGYAEQKGLVEDLILMGLKNPEVYDDIASRTRKDKKAQRPKAVLFEGPPGTGKTTSARIIAKQAAVPLVYIPLESVASKWYGESEQKLSQMLTLAEAMGGCIIFLDEVDSLATSRGDNINEATRRLLGVLLRFIDGFEATNSIVVAATNRKQDLDAALISRFDSIITFGLPDTATRASILKHYAAHLTDDELRLVANITPGMSARDLRAICEVTERRWASAIIRGEHDKGSVPPLDSYLLSAKARRRSLSNSDTAHSMLSSAPSIFADAGEYLDVGQQ